MDSAEVTEMLPIKLKEHEVEERANQATQLMSELVKKEESYKLVKRAWNLDLKKIREEMLDCCQAWTTKTQEREVECTHTYCLESGKTWFEYEGERYKERAITDDERQCLQQGSMFDDGANLPDQKSFGPETETVPHGDEEQGLPF